MKSLLTNSIVALTVLNVIFAASAASADSTKSRGNFNRNSVRSQSQQRSRNHNNRQNSQARRHQTINTQRRTAGNATTRSHRNHNLKNTRVTRQTQSRNNHKNTTIKMNTKRHDNHVIKKNLSDYAVKHLGRGNATLRNKSQRGDKGGLKVTFPGNRGGGKSGFHLKPEYKPEYQPEYKSTNKPHILVNGRHHKARVCLPKLDWCHNRPAKCHWWYTYCKPIRYCRPVDCVKYTCNYVTADYRLSSGIVVEDVRWHLGLSGILLPGKGFAIETVEEGSPAGQAGFQPGMVIIATNGIDITAEDSLPNAIAASNGILIATVLVQLDAEPVQVTILMQRLVSASF